MGFISTIKNFCFVALRVWKYRVLSDCNRVSGNPNRYHPLLLKGAGRISFGRNVQIGVVASPHYYSHYSFIEARFENSEIHIGNNVAVNNNFSAVAFSNIHIGDHVLIGVNCSIMDNDGHSLPSTDRNSGNPESAAVSIGENVFLGDNVTILKGVSIGHNSVIGNGSVVTNSIGANVIAAGNPAREIRKI